MSKLYTICLSFEVKSPVLCSSAGTSRWGLDKTVFKNHEGKPAIPSSHVKGKLREAWRELIAAGAFPEKGIFEPSDGKDHPFIEKWLGAKPGEGSFLPGKGLALFSDFVCGDEVEPGNITRIAINRESGTAKEEALLNVESLYKPGKPTTWTGSVEFPAKDEGEADKIRGDIMAGLRWITAVGSEKGIGFGVLEKVKQLDWKPQPCERPEPLAEAPSYFDIAITMDEPVLLGGKRIRNNYLKSESIITGAVIKGTLARSIQRGLGLESPILSSGCEKLEAAGLGRLGGHYEKIRFTHAFPSRNPVKRAVAMPLSIVKDAKGKIHDVSGNEYPDTIDGVAPAFAIDWKDHFGVNKAYGWADVKILAYTRTAIEGVSRRAKDEMLFTYEYVLPKFEDEDDNHKEKFVTWLGRAYLPKGLNEADSRALAGELKFVLEKWFSRVGKRDAKILKVVAIPPGLVTPAIDSDPKKRGEVAITLQTEALMLDPRDPGLAGKPDLKCLYGAFWGSVSGGAFNLKRFFAQQTLHGGYLGRRFKARGSDSYHPFFLTGAGSVFVLEVRDQGKAEAFLNDWKALGLPPPRWAADMYGTTPASNLDWQKCPFTRENGFGEIAVNLSLPVIPAKNKGA